MLDLCCYTGAFSLAAARGGARSVTGVDLDEKALVVARHNAELNKLQVEWVHADAFDHLRTGVSADLVVLDPPKLARARQELGRAHKHSVDLNALALGAVRPGGRLHTFCCTGLISPDAFQAQVRDAARRAGRKFEVLEVVGQPADHPVAPDCPEGRYLTGLVVEVA